MSGIFLSRPLATLKVYEILAILKSAIAPRPRNAQEMSRNLVADVARSPARCNEG